MTFLIVFPYGTVSFWHYITLDGARLGEVHLRLSLPSPAALPMAAFVGLVKTFFVAPFSAFHNVRAPAGH